MDLQKKRSEAAISERENWRLTEREYFSDYASEYRDTEDIYPT